MPVPPIVAVQGVPSEEIQHLFNELAVRWQAAGLRVAGVLAEVTPAAPGGRSKRTLRDIATSTVHLVSQDLGQGSTSCYADVTGYAAACAGAEAAMRQGCDVAIISKFGKLEMERGGLMSVFQAAIEADASIVTSVPPYATEVWQRFAGPLAMFIRADYEAIEAWRRARAHLRTASDALTA